MVQKASKVILLIDSSKFEQSLPYSFCELSDVDIIITDGNFSRYKKEAAACGTQIVTADVPVQREHVTKCIPIEI